MRMLRSLLIAFAFALLFSQAAFAGTGTIVVKDGNGTSQTYDVITDGSGRFGAMVGICDGSALASCATVGTLGTNPGSVPALLTNAYILNGTTDPCASGVGKTTINISQAGTAVIVTGTPAQNIYVCGGLYNVADAESVSLIEGTGSTCSTGTPFALIGSTTAANGMALAANEGISLGTGAATTYYANHTAGDNLCILQSGTGRVAGGITYVSK